MSPSLFNDDSYIYSSLDVNTWLIICLVGLVVKLTLVLVSLQETIDNLKESQVKCLDKINAQSVSIKRCSDVYDSLDLLKLETKRCTRYFTTIHYNMNDFEKKFIKRHQNISKNNKSLGKKLDSLIHKVKHSKLISDKERDNIACEAYYYSIPEGGGPATVVKFGDDHLVVEDDWWDDRPSCSCRAWEKACRAASVGILSDVVYPAEESDLIKGTFRPYISDVY
jgi:hypothetical protein